MEQKQDKKREILERIGKFGSKIKAELSEKSQELLTASFSKIVRSNIEVISKVISEVESESIKSVLENLKQENEKILEKIESSKKVEEEQIEKFEELLNVEEEQVEKLSKLDTSFNKTLKEIEKFKKETSNILQREERLTPVGVLKGIWKGYKEGGLKGARKGFLEGAFGITGEEKSFKEKLKKGALATLGWGLGVFGFATESLLPILGANKIFETLRSEKEEESDTEIKEGFAEVTSKLEDQNKTLKEILKVQKDEFRFQKEVEQDKELSWKEKEKGGEEIKVIEETPRGKLSKEESGGLFDFGLVKKLWGKFKETKLFKKLEESKVGRLISKGFEKVKGSRLGRLFGKGKGLIEKAESKVLGKAEGVLSKVGLGGLLTKGVEEVGEAAVEKGLTKEVASEAIKEVGTSGGVLSKVGSLLSKGKGLLGKGFGKITEKIGLRGLKDIGEKVGLKGLTKIGEKIGLGGLKKFGVKALEKIGLKGLGKLGLKEGLKVGLKKIPLVGALTGLALAVPRLVKGDVLGAVGEVASGLASTIPGIGTAASAAIDAALIAHDINQELEKGELEKTTQKIPLDKTKKLSKDLQKSVGLKPAEIKGKFENKLLKSAVAASAVGVAAKKLTPKKRELPETPKTPDKIKEDVEKKFEQSPIPLTIKEYARVEKEKEPIVVKQEPPQVIIPPKDTPSTEPPITIGDSDSFFYFMHRMLTMGG